MGGKIRYDDRGRKICPSCGIGQDNTNYQTQNGKPSGWCRLCRTQKERDRRRANGQTERVFSVVQDGKKTCLHCNEIKPLTDFSPSKKGTGSVQSYCKPCFADRNRDKKKARERTKAYRKRKGPEYLAQHRLNQFKRRTNIEAVSDGTVTKEFLENLYEVECCHYCGNQTPRNFRTADHVIPLSTGGIHSSENLVMACFSCNSSKRDLPAETFLERLQNAE